MIKDGAELKVGDAVDLWFNHKTVLLEIKPYRGSLNRLWPKGVWIGVFSANTKSGRLEMTVGSNEYFTVVED